MSISYTYAGSAVTHNIEPSSILIPTRADMGRPASGKIPIEDPEKTLVIVGHKPFIVEESACSQPRLFTGWTTQRDIARSEEEGMFVGPDPSLADMTIVDLNALFNFRIIRGGGTGNGKRPSETWNERLAWILADDTLDGLIEITNEDWVISRNLVMDEADYRGQPPSAVFDDLLQRPPIRQLTYFAAWDPDEEAVGLFFHELGEATNDSTLSISNDPADVDETTCFAPWMDTTLARKPDQVYSEVLVEWPGGRTFRTRPSTEAVYGRRGTPISRPYCKSRARAQEYGDAFLDRHDSEEDVITTQILVPAASAGLVMAGQRISCKFTHLDGYETFTSLRVTECKPTPATDIGDLYLISLELVAPKAGSAPPLTECDENALAGITATEGATNIPSNIFGADPNGGVIQNPTLATDGDSSTDYDSSAYYMSGVWSGSHERIWEFVITLPATSIVRKVSVLASVNGAGIAPYTEGGEFYMIVGGTTYDESYATIPDDDIWDWADANAGMSAGTWDFGADVETNSITFGYTETRSDYCPYVAVAEIAACLVGADEQEEVDPQFPDPVVSTDDPTADDDAEDGYQVGQLWINTTNNYTYLLVDSTVGAAVWTLITTGTPAWNFSTSDGTTTVDPTVELTFVGPTLTDLGAGVAELTFAATPDAATTVEDETTWGITPAVGSDTEYARQDHTHGSPANPATGAVGPLLISDSPSTPLVFADILQNEDEDDLLYADL